MGPEEGAPSVELALLDELLEQVAAALHDRPVQQLVAAKLMVETAVPPEARSAVLARGIEAIGTAGQQSRELMWALTPPEVREGEVPRDVRDAVGRGRALEGAEIVVDLDDDVDVAAARALVAAVHDVLVDVRMAGGAVGAVRVLADAEALQGEVHADRGGPEGSPWLRLAARRAAVAGGVVERGGAGHDGGAVEGHRVAVRIPLPD